MRHADVAVIGGGIVGLAVAYTLARARPAPRVVVLEKETRLAAHQSGRNSGVVHSGVYYAPGSLKARFSRRGGELLEAFCREHALAFERCGKVLVAVAESELPRLDALHERARTNGVACELVDRARLRELEPHAAGLRALHVPATGITDFAAVCAKLAELVRVRRGDIALGARAVGLSEQSGVVEIATTAGELTANAVVNCAGLHSDRVLQLTGATRTARIVPFRGEYFELAPEARGLCRNLIYPVPDPSLPFLGVHFTRSVAGHVHCGPNAVPALAREGYAWSDVELVDVLDVLSFPGAWRLARKHARTGASEILRSLSRRAFARALQRLVPEVEARHLVPAPSGVRAQALANDGSLVDDFVIRRTGRVLHVCNAPSPAATSSLAIAEAIAAELT